MMDELLLQPTTLVNIKRGFKASGFVPYNPNIFTDSFVHYSL